MTHPVGTYLVVRGDNPPTVEILSEASHTAYQSRGMRGRDRKAVVHQFGGDAVAAFPAWILESMVGLAENFQGPHADRVKGIAAAIALGRPYGGPERGDEPGKGNGSGGVKVGPRRPKGPRGPSTAAAPDFAALMASK